MLLSFISIYNSRLFWFLNTGFLYVKLPTISFVSLHSLNLCFVFLFCCMFYYQSLNIDKGVKSNICTQILLCLSFIVFQYLKKWLQSEKLSLILMKLSEITSPCFQCILILLCCLIFLCNTTTQCLIYYTFMHILHVSLSHT